MNELRTGLLCAAGIWALLALCPRIAAAAVTGTTRGDPEGACTLTARVQRAACGYEVTDDYLTHVANCLNLSDAAERAQCLADAATAQGEATAECTASLDLREGVCDLVGEAAYDPEIDPENFVDPADIGGSVAPNPYFPLVPGSVWIYSGGGEIDRVEVTGETRVIEGVTVAVIHDVVAVDGEVIEDTEDWVAQDLAGNLWYFGEISQEFEDGELIGVEGSWKHGVDFAKAGTLFLAAPQVADSYRQEFSLGNAEDVVTVLSTTGSESVPAASCDGDCVVTADYTPLSPGGLENKYYAPGVGPMLVVKPATGAREELVGYQIGAR